MAENPTIDDIRWIGDVQILDDCMAALVSPQSNLRRHGGHGQWTEGPVYLPLTDTVIWSDIPNNVIMSFGNGEIGVWRSPSNFTNGHTLDHQDRIIHCSHGARAVLCTDHDGTVTTLVDRYKGGRLNSPNDVVVKSDGTIWFTDPPYGILSNREGYKADSEQEGCFVYRFDPATGDLTSVVTDMVHPNGLAFSVDESLLYVSDTAQGFFGDTGDFHIRVYDVIDGVTTAHGRGFVRIAEGLSDGFRLDTHGNIYTSAADAIYVISPQGTTIGRIPVPEKVSNCCWGGPDRCTLFITGSTGLYSIDLLTSDGRGAGPR